MMINRDRNLFQYRNATALNNLQDRFFNIAKSLAPDNLINILNIDMASGEWLTQLAKIFNVSRSYFGSGATEGAFILDVSLLDSSDVLDGILVPMDDNLLRALLKAKILRNSNTPKTIDYIYNVFYIVFGEDLDIEVVEYDDKIIQIVIDFGANTNGFRILQALITDDKGWYGNPTGVYTIYDFDVDAK